ncbi:MAG: hypothetical protein PF694_07655 [Bacteroidetes bacterium]|jgi:predicted nucleic acid-binding Zn ribbon protein|nr:hypothetical protein [Bacteroidota bacterium]
MEKHCLSCGEVLIGRADKKFCNDSCRNNYHHQRNHDQINLIRNINNVLKKNRAILKELNPDGKAKIRKQQLDRQGFNFKYYTTTYVTKDKRVYYFVYDQGYLPLENEFYALVENSEIG